MRIHAMAIPTHATGTEQAVDCGIAQSLTDAKRLIRAAGYKIMAVGGSIDRYDAQDAPGVYGYKPDGLGAIGITVRI